MLLRPHVRVERLIVDSSRRSAPRSGISGSPRLHRRSLWKKTSRPPERRSCYLARDGIRGPVVYARTGRIPPGDAPRRPGGIALPAAANGCPGLASSQAPRRAALWVSSSDSSTPTLCTHTNCPPSHPEVPSVAKATISRVIAPVQRLV